jgi:hypothetical protein
LKINSNNDNPIVRSIIVVREKMVEILSILLRVGLKYLAGH